MNALVMPAIGSIWKMVGLQLAANNISPAIWFGPSKLSKFAQDNFDDCEVVNYQNLHEEIQEKPIKCFADSTYLRSREFIQMKLQVLKLMDRQDDIRAYGKLEREAMFYGMFNYLYSIIKEKNISLLISCEAPHGPGYLIAYKICQRLNIPTYHLVPNTLVPAFQVNTTIVGEPIRLAALEGNQSQTTRLREILNRYSDGIPTPPYMQNQADFEREYRFRKVVVEHWRDLLRKKLKEILRITIRPHDNIVRYARYPFDKNQVRWNHPFIVRRLRHSLASSYQSLAESVSPKEMQSRSFVYFPMPYEPERTSNPDGGDFFEAMDALIALREFVPLEIEILVKEHPSQFSSKLRGYQGRSPLHYRAIAQLENVKLVDLSVPSAQLIERAAAVFCITGTAALEAALVGTPGVVFGTPWFVNLPGVHWFDDLRRFTDLAPETPGITEISSVAEALLIRTSIDGVASGSQERYFKQRFGEDWLPEDWAERAARLLVETILADVNNRQ